MDAALKSGKAFIVFNKDMRHATVAVCLALKHADKEIWLLSEKLDPVLYGSEWFLAEAADFLGRREGKMHILVESDLPDGHPIQQITAEHADDGRLTIMRIPDDLREQYVYNYMVVDDKGYRFERDRKHPKAIVAFNVETDQGEQGLITALKDNFGRLSKRAVRGT